MVAANENSINDDQQRHSKTAQKSLVKGDTWYVISSKWYNNWSQYAKILKEINDLIDEDKQHPGKIDNGSILKNGRLNPDALEPDDYLLVHEELYQFLLDKYGIVSEEHKMPRKVIEIDSNRTERFLVEVFPLQLMIRVPQRADVQPFRLEFSKANNVDDVIKKVTEHMKVTDKLQLHLEVDKGEFEKLSPSSSLFSVCNKRTMTVELEFPDRDGKWSRDNRTRCENGATASVASSSSSIYGTSSSTYQYCPKSRVYVSNPGLRGLNNLGNTCFMNSAIQSLSNVPSLTEYFRKAGWKKEINAENPLGMSGEIAQSYAELIESLWSEGGSSTFMPRRFKMAVGKFAPQFCGFQQQDAQELMAFLLDGLHEDLNRIKKKPYVEVKDYDEKEPDEEVAMDSWKNYQKRNDSVIVDQFHGQLRSELHCPECQRLSVTFDPFCYLSLPLPAEEVPISVTLVRAGRSSRSQLPYPLLKYTLRVGTDITYREFLKRFRDASDMQETHFIISDVQAQNAHLRNFPPSYNLIDISMLDNSPTSRISFYAIELKDAPQGRADQYLVRVDFLSANKYQQRPWLVVVGKEYLETNNHDARRRLIYDALLKDDSFLSVFPGLQELANNNSLEVHADPAVNNGGQGSEPMQVDDTSEMDKHFSLEFVRRNSPQPKFLDIVETKLQVKAPPGFFDVDEDDSVSSLKGVGRGVYLRNCLDMFTKKERLGERDSWYCNKCKKHQRATKKFDLWKLPDTLVIHIKRFGNANRLWRNKLNTKVFFPLEDLDMGPWVKNKLEENQYDLVSVVNHYGSMGGGHYTAFGRNKDDKMWYNFDDSSVTSTTAESVVTQNAYVLVYVRQKCATSAGLMDTD